jgi:hypothetical protein
MPGTKGAGHLCIHVIVSDCRRHLCKSDALCDNVPVKAKVELFHLLPSFLPDDARANKYIVLQRDVGSSSSSRNSVTACCSFEERNGARTSCLGSFSGIDIVPSSQGERGRKTSKSTCVLRALAVYILSCEPCLDALSKPSTIWSLHTRL